MFNLCIHDMDNDCKTLLSEVATILYKYVNVVYYSKVSLPSA